MKKLKIILQSNEIYYLLLLITILITSLKIFLVVTFPYEKENTTKIGIVQNIQIDGNQLTLQLKNKIQGKYTIQSKKEKQWISKSINIGDKIKLEGILSQTNQLNEFIMIKKYQKLKSRTNLWIKIKRFIIKKASKNAYLKAFILGDKGDLSQEEITSYQENGISHLLALSGMHVTIISTILFKILQILFPKKKIAYQLTNIFLLLYLNIVELSPSILRATIFYILSIQNKLYQLSIKPINLWIMVLSIVLLINPFYLINVGFQYSFFISFILIFMREWINNSKTKINQFLKISYLSYIASIPISLFHFYQINVLSILYNLIFIPYITIIVFPLSLLTLGINQILPVYNIVTTILREASLLLNKMKYLTIICKKLSFVIYIIYVISIFYYLYYLKQGKKKYPISLMILLLIHTIYPKIYSKSYIEMIDVGQGDSILLSSKGHHILVDTGGQIKLEKELWKKQKRQYSIVRTKTIPLLKSLGIKKIDNLILTHGDMDHLGEATILLDNFQVENIILNLGTLNQKEQEIKKKYKKVTQIKQDQEITCGEIKLIQLNKEFKEENESSQIYYAKYKQRKILLMADAEEKSENYILNTYNLEPIDILKVSHHGSKYSTIEPFLKIIHPKISLISVGENNQFSHPHKELIARLKKYQTKIYQTKQSGNITINLDNLKVTEEKPTE